MSQQKDIGADVSFVAGEDLSSVGPNCAVKLHTTENQVVKCSANGDAIGILQNNPESGQLATVRIHGSAKVKAGAAVTLNDKVKSDASGRAVTGGTSADVNFGQAMEAAAAANELIEVLLYTPANQITA